MAAMDALWHRVASGRPYPLVLLDARMPDTDGLALAGKIRREGRACRHAHHPVDFRATARATARFRELQIDAHLLKPVQEEELLETIYRVMSRAKGNALTRPAAPAPGNRRAGLGRAIASHSCGRRQRVQRQLMEQLLIRQGHRVQITGNGREALTLADEGGFDLLLLDIHMPELDGFQVVQALREREQNAARHLPVIALTAHSRKEDRERCLAAGMDNFLTKPVRPAELWAAIDRVMKTHPPGNLPARSCSMCRCCWPRAGATPSCSGRCASRSRRESRNTWQPCAAPGDQDAPPRRRPTNSVACFRSSRRLPAGGRATWKISRPAHRFRKLPRYSKNSKRWLPS